MRVRIRLLSTYRKYLPPDVQGASYGLEVSAGTRIEELRSQLPVPSDEDQVVLINGRTPVPGQLLIEGDTIAVFPSMAGG